MENKKNTDLCVNDYYHDEPTVDELENLMFLAVDEDRFEDAAILRDNIKTIMNE